MQSIAASPQEASTSRRPSNGTATVVPSPRQPSVASTRSGSGTVSAAVEVLEHKRSPQPRSSQAVHSARSPPTAFRRDTRNTQSPGGSPASRDLRSSSRPAPPPASDSESSRNGASSTEAIIEGDSGYQKGPGARIGLGIAMTGYKDVAERGERRRASDTGIKVVSSRLRSQRPSLPGPGGESSSASTVSSVAKSKSPAATSSLPFNTNGIASPSLLYARSSSQDSRRSRRSPASSTKTSPIRNSTSRLPSVQVMNPTPTKLPRSDRRSSAARTSPQRPTIPSLGSSSSSSSVPSPSKGKGGSVGHPGSRRTSYVVAEGTSRNPSRNGSMASEFGMMAEDADGLDLADTLKAASPDRARRTTLANRSEPHLPEASTRSQSHQTTGPPRHSVNIASGRQSFSTDKGTSTSGRIMSSSSRESFASLNSTSNGVVIPRRTTSNATSPAQSPRTRHIPPISPRTSSMFVEDLPPYPAAHTNRRASQNVALGNVYTEQNGDRTISTQSSESSLSSRPEDRQERRASRNSISTAKSQSTPRNSMTSTIQGQRRTSRSSSAAAEQGSSSGEASETHILQRRLSGVRQAQSGSSSAPFPVGEGDKSLSNRIIDRRNPGLTIAQPPAFSNSTEKDLPARPSPPVPAKSPLRRLSKTPIGMTSINDTAQSGRSGILPRTGTDTDSSATTSVGDGLVPGPVQAERNGGDAQTRLTTMTGQSVYSQDSAPPSSKTWTESDGPVSRLSDSSMMSGVRWGQQRHSIISVASSLGTDEVIRVSTSLPRLRMPDQDPGAALTQSPSDATSTPHLSAISPHSLAPYQILADASSPGRSPSMPSLRAENLPSTKAYRLLGVDPPKSGMARSQTSPIALLPSATIPSPRDQATATLGLSKRAHLLREIATTERLYANDLALVRDAYLSPYIRPPSQISTGDSSLSNSIGETSRRSSVYTYQTAETKRSSGYDSSTPWLGMGTSSFVSPLPKSPGETGGASYFSPLTASASTTSVLATPQTGPRHLSASASGGSMPPPIGKPLAPADIRVVFMNLAQLAAAAEEMASAMERAIGAGIGFEVNGSNESLEVKDGDNGSDRIGEIFVNLMPRFRSLYSSYCARQAIASVRLQEILADPTHATYLNSCWNQIKPKTHAWNLDSMLIKPVQRITKYPLLFDDLLACTTPVHPDYFHIRSAAAMAKSVAVEIDEAKRRKDIVAGVVSKRVPSSSAASIKDSKSGGIGKGLKLFRKERSMGGGHLVSASAVSLDIDTSLAIPRISLNYYRELVSDFEQSEQCVRRAGKEMLLWTAAAKNLFVLQDSMMRAWLGVVRLEPSDPTDPRMVAFRTLLARLIPEIWEPLSHEVQEKIIPVLSKLLESGANPRKVMVKRDSKASDYARYLTLSEAKRPVDRTIVQSSHEFTALHTQLVEELPAFLEGYMRVFDLAITAFARAQAKYHTTLKDRLEEFVLAHLSEKKSPRIGSPKKTRKQSIGDGGQVINRGDDPDLKTGDGITQRWHETWTPYSEAMDHLQCTKSARAAASRIASFNDRPGSHTHSRHNSTNSIGGSGGGGGGSHSRSGSPGATSPSLRHAASMSNSRPSSPAPKARMSIRHRATSLVQPPGSKNSSSGGRGRADEDTSRAPQNGNGLMPPPTSPFRERPRIRPSSLVDPSIRHSFGLPKFSPDSGKLFHGLGVSPTNGPRPSSPGTRVIGDPLATQPGHGHPFLSISRNTSASSLASTNAGLGFGPADYSPSAFTALGHGSSARTPERPPHRRQASAASTLGMSSETPSGAIPVADASEGWRNEKVLYQCACVASFHPDEIGNRRYRGLQFLGMAVGDIFDVFHEVGRIDDLPSFPYRDIAVENDGLLVARREDGSIGLVICSFLEHLT